MRRFIFLLPWLLLCCVTTASSAYLDGFVVLYPIEYGSFRSAGWATYYNDFNQPESAALSGEHAVTEVYPSSSSFVVPVTGDGSYSYWLEGPTNPGSCYETSLHVIARPAGQTQREETWYGYTQQCDSRSAQPTHYYLSVWINVDGTVTPGGGTGYQAAGSTVVVSTSAAAGYEFQGWSGDASSTDLSIQVYMDRDKTVTANWTFHCDPATDPNCPCDPAIDPNCCDPSDPSCNNHNWEPPNPGNPPNSPIVLNLGRGNYQLTGTNDAVLFDIQASGTPLRIGWTAPLADEPFLCLDRNGNGRIDDGSELFGTATHLNNGLRAANGFDALAEYDGNRDGIIDEQDAIWPQLLLWRDLNHDGISQPSELTPVARDELTAISLNYHWSGRRDVFGNTFRYQATAWAGQTPRPVYDIFFVVVP